MLLLSSSDQTARADCEYDDDWCCDPQTWCEALHFGFYLFIISLLLTAIAGAVYEQYLLGRLARDVVRQGTATSAKVLAIQAKRRNTEDAPFAIMGYAALVQLTPPGRFPSDAIIKWVKISEAQHQQLAVSLSSSGSGGGTVQHLPTTLRYGESHPQVISEDTLQQSLKEANAGKMEEILVYTWSEYPKLAVSGDPNASGFNKLEKILFTALLVGCSGLFIFLVLWFASTYEYNLFQAGAKFGVLVAFVILAVGIPLLIRQVLKVYYRADAERDFFLTDEVRVGGEGTDDPTAQLAPEESTPLVSRSLDDLIANVKQA